MNEPPLHDDLGESHSEKPHVWALLLYSLIAMIPWPLMATVACVHWSMLDQASEALLLLGGVTIMCLLPLGLLDPPEWVFVAFIAVVWLIVLGLPFVLVVRRAASRSNVVALLAFQAAFSFVQAGLGLLMIWGKAA